MAVYPAIAATSQAILGLLERAAAEPGSEFGGTHFALYRGDDLQNPMTNGVALYLHHVVVNADRRNLPPRVWPDGLPRRPAVPLDLHYLLIAWAEDAVKQQRLLGWCVRVIEDTSILPAGLLNHFGPEHDVFRPDETVEVMLEPLSLQDQYDIWEGADQHRQPAAAYLARVVEIESLDVPREGAPVQVRDLEFDTQVPV